MSSCKAETVVTFLSTMISPAWLSTLLVVVFLSGGAFLRISIPPLSPSTAVRHLAASIDKEITFFDTHAGELGTFNGKLRSLRYKSLALSRELRQADDAFSWIDKDTWLRYIFRLKKIWNNTRDHQRALDALGKRMRDVIFAKEEERSRAEAEIAQNTEIVAVFDMPYRVPAVP